MFSLFFILWMRGLILNFFFKEDICKKIVSKFIVIVLLELFKAPIWSSAVQGLKKPCS